MNIRSATEISLVFIVSLFFANATVGKVCYGLSMGGALLTWGVFVLPAMLLPLAGLWLKKPAASIGSLLFFTLCFTWLAFDGCTLRYAGGGAYVAYFFLIFMGLPASLLGFVVGRVFERVVLKKAASPR